MSFNWYPVDRVQKLRSAPRFANCCGKLVAIVSSRRRKKDWNSNVTRCSAVKYIQITSLQTPIRACRFADAENQSPDVAPSCHHVTIMWASDRLITESSIKLYPQVGQPLLAGNSVTWGCRQNKTRKSVDCIAWQSWIDNAALKISIVLAAA